MINPSRVAFNFIGRPIYWYGILMALGIACAVILAVKESRRKHLDEDNMLDLCLIAIPCGVIGARLYYVLFELERYLDNPIRILQIWEGGLAIYGAIIGGAIGIYIYSRMKSIRFLKVVDLLAPGLALAQAIGRWGNFFNQEAFGLPVTNEALLWFPFAVRIDGIHFFDKGDGLGAVFCQNPYHLATFFYESMWCLLLFAFLWFYLRKRVKHDGDVFIWYAMLYSFERMFIESLRGDSLWLINGVVRVSQLLSFIIFAGALAFLIIRNNKEKKLGKLIWPDMGVTLEQTDSLEPKPAKDGLFAKLFSKSKEEKPKEEETNFVDSLVLTSDKAEEAAQEEAQAVEQAEEIAAQVEEAAEEAVEEAVEEAEEAAEAAEEAVEEAEEAAQEAEQAAEEEAEEVQEAIEEATQENDK